MSAIQLTKNQKSTINAIIASRTRRMLDQEAENDDIAALAVDLGLKPAKVRELVSVIMAEQGKGGVIEEKSRILDLAEQVVGGHDTAVDETTVTIKTIADVSACDIVDAEFDENNPSASDPFFDEAVRIVTSTGNTSAAHLQRVLRLGYTRSFRLLDAMEKKGIVGPLKDEGGRDILTPKGV